jgi:hypothetical protein
MSLVIALDHLEAYLTPSNPSERQKNLVIVKRYLGTRHYLLKLMKGRAEDQELSE